ncbi:hypothetical protein VP1G_07552 [Cytospora mali]|uniref:Uncharacterized protein n=1 Tax=Cytospora mali TaxID=578113 RepID=A0A194V8P9_CYTMA|nr:hypothetical protein VP1G_07552 [Valsa mali var. pyri (nom. inval.)]
MVSRFRSAVESTPVSDRAVGQGHKTTASRDRKRKSNDFNAVQEGEVVCPVQKSRRLSRASSRPDGHRDDALSQTSLVLATPAPLGRAQRAPVTTKPQLYSLHRPRIFQCPINNNSLSFDPSHHDSEASKASDVGVPLVGHPPQGAGGKRHFCFFDFPAEIRNMIYDHILHWPDCVDLYRSFYRQIPAYPTTHDKPHSSHYQRSLKTPTILLLCRRITEESLPILRSRWLIIDRLPPFVPGGLMSITDFIGRQTLQSLHHIDLRIGLGEGPLGSGWIWTRLLDEILAVLRECNSIVKFRLLIRMCNKEMASRWDQERRYDHDIRKVCIIPPHELTLAFKVNAVQSTDPGKKLRNFREANPNVFTPSEIIVEKWRIEGMTATFVSRHPRPSDEDEPPPPDRSYPDREMFPGSVMQFVKPLPASSWSDEDVSSRLGGDL